MINPSLSRPRGYRMIGVRTDVPHFVYRCYDADGDLVYVGCTSNVKKRMAAHRRGDHSKASRCLSVFMDRYEVEGPYPDRATALRAEAEAIATEQPVFNQNMKGVATYPGRRTIARYLVERGHQDLAIEMVCTCAREARDAEAVDEMCDAHVGHGPLFDFDAYFGSIA